MSDLNFQDHNAAMRMRDLITKIVRTEIDTSRPDIRIGRVYSFDSSSLIAQVLFVGHTVDNLIPVRYAHNMTPAQAMVTDFADQGYDASSDIVRVAGVGSNLYITDYVLGGPSFVSDSDGAASYPDPIIQDFVTAIDTWNINHNFDWQYVDVICMDLITEEPIEGDIYYSDANNVQVKFAVGVSGRAIVKKP